MTKLTLISFLSSMALAAGLGMLALRTINLCIRAYAAQSFFLACVALTIGLSDSHTFMVGLIILAVKGFLIPWYLLRVIEEVQIKHDTDPFVPYPIALLVGVVLVVLSYVVMEPLLATRQAAAGGFGLALAMMQLGLWLMVTRRKAITQTIGVLVVENGVFAAILSMSTKIPIVIELGLIFDLMIAVIIMGLLIFRMRSTFMSISTSNLTRLKG